MTVLPLAYLPSAEYFAHLLRGGCVVDLGEHFVKRSERNRARILATDGVMELTVHVRNANRPRQPVRDVRIDYSKRWQHQHWGALVASYKGSPYFDFYAEYFEPFYRREYGFLADYNRGLLELLCSLTHVPMPDFSESYVDAAAGDLDLRPKRKKEGPATGPSFIRHRALRPGTRFPIRGTKAEYPRQPPNRPRRPRWDPWRASAGSSRDRPSGPRSATRGRPSGRPKRLPNRSAG